MTSTPQVLTAADVATITAAVVEGAPPYGAAYLAVSMHLIAAPGNWIRRTAWPAGTRVEFGDDTAFLVQDGLEPAPWTSSEADVAASDWETGVTA